MCLIIPREIESERLVLRCPTAADGPAIHAGVLTSWTALSTWMHWAVEPKSTVAETTERAGSRAAAFDDRSAFNYAVFEKTSGTLIGMFALQDFDWAVPRGEIGGWLVSAHVGRGFAAEAVRMLVATGASMGLRRIEWRCDVNNARSRAVAVRAGFTLEGIMRQHTLTPHGQLRDTCVYAQVF
jgi:RimJ/RimL family protein N-acetyltransferase